MQPKVTIILPVYNVEPYLRQCLDSVVNQTMREIQIVCVNDGSTDGSLAILREYESRDSRIEIIHQENQGGGSARNAAYPFIRGKYTYFVDPDDWIELDLCRRCYDKAEATEADFVALRCIEHKPYPKCSPPFDPMLPEVRQAPEEKSGEFVGRGAGTWKKFSRSDFLLLNNIRCSEGKRPYNDQLFAWKGMVLANRIAILDSPLYHYRIRQGSYQRTIDESHFIIAETFNEIEKMLHETERYESYRNLFHEEKFAHYSVCYRRLPPTLRSKFLELIRRSLAEIDREFYRKTGIMKKRELRFYRGIVEGNRLETAKYYFFEIIKLPERLWKVAVINPWRTVLAHCTNTPPSTTNTNTIPFPAQESGESPERRVA